MKKAAKIFLKILLWLFVTVLLVFILVQTPPVQNFARKKLVSFLENKLDTRVQIGHVYIGLPSAVIVKNVYLEDKSKDTLLYGGQIKVNISLFKLLSNKVQINEIRLEDMTAKIKRQLPDTAFNFQFIIDSFATQNAKPANPNDTTGGFDISINDVYLDNIRFIYDDTLSGNDWTIQLGHFHSDIETFDLEKMLFEIPDISLDGLTAVMRQYKPLVTAEDVVNNDTSAGALPILKFRDINLDNISFDYRNAVSALSTQASWKSLEAKANNFSLESRVVALSSLNAKELRAKVLMGKSESSKLVAEKVKTEAEDVANQNWRIVADEIALENSFLQYDDNNSPRQPYGMDYAHLDAQNINLEVKDLLFANDTIMVDVSQASMKEKSGLDLRQLEGHFYFTGKDAGATDFLVQTASSTIREDIQVTYPSLESIQDHPESLQFKASLPNSQVSTHDILLFVPDLRQQPLFANPNDVFRLDASISGSIAHITAQKLLLEGPGNTYVDINGTIAGLPDPEKMRGSIHINRFSTSGRYIAGFLPASARQNISIPANIYVKGMVEGNATQAQTALQVQTSSGNLGLYGTLQNYKQTAAATYDMQVKADALDAGQILKNPAMQQLTASFRVHGKGLSMETADASLTGSIESVGYNGYTYNNIPLEASFHDQQVQANISANDPNIHFAADVTADLSNTDPAVKGTIIVDSIKTGPLKLTPQAYIYRGKILADMKNINPDKLQGKVNIIHSLLVLQGERRIQLDTVTIRADHYADSNRLQLVSDVANLTLEGKYQLTQIGNIIQQGIQPYFNIMPASASLATANNIAPYNFTVAGYVNESPVIATLVPSVSDFGGLSINAHFATDSGWTANLNSASLTLNTLHVEGLELQAGSGKDSLRATISAGQLKIANNSFYGFKLDAQAANNQMIFNTSFNDPAGNRRYALGGSLQQPQFGNYRISFNPNAILNYQEWTIAPDNSIQILDNDLRVTNFMLNRNFQQLSLKTRGTDPNSPLEAYFTSFHLSTLTAFALPDSLPMDGTLDGQVLLRDLMGQPSLSGDMTVNDLHFRNDTVGNVAIKASYSASGTVNADIALTGKGNDVTLKGNYYTRAVNGNNLDMQLAINKLNLESVQGATMGAIKNASGDITGKFNVTGSSSQPAINGNLNLKQTSFTLSMLNSKFTIDNETIAVNREGVRFNTFRIKDSTGNTAVIDGMLYTSDFTSYRFNLDVRADHFQALNSTKKDNDLYYGSLVFSSNMHIRGTNLAPVIDGSVTIEDKTDMTVVLPTAQPGVVEREGIVQFVDMDAPENDTLFMNGRARFDSLNKSPLTGMDISANVELKKEAVFTMVVDQGTGDFVRMQGEGLLNGSIDKSGKVTLSGSYEITSGTYELTFNLLKRKFEIQKGSKILWTGEPTTANLDVTAIYVAETAPLDLVKNQAELTGANTNVYLQRLPFEVHLNMDGELLKPDITFDIVLPDDRSYRVNNEVITLVKNKLTQLRQEPSELNKQVFALLLLNRFVSENPFESSSGGMSAESLARQSASRLLSEQLNRLTENLINGVDINFDLESNDDYTTGSRQTRTDLNVALSKRLLNDRLEVTVGSNFELEGPQSSGANANNLAGNVAIDYQLSKDGRYLLRAYRKNEYEGVIDGYVIETGVGFVITLDYNRFRNLFISKKERERRRERRKQRRLEEKEMQKQEEATGQTTEDNQETK